MELDQYHCHGTGLFRFPRLLKQSAFGASLSANNSGGAIVSGVRSGMEEVFDEAVVENADEKTESLTERQPLLRCKTVVFERSSMTP